MIGPFFENMNLPYYIAGFFIEADGSWIPLVQFTIERRDIR
jgi:hypothetical protein